MADGEENDRRIPDIVPNWKCEPNRRYKNDWIPEDCRDLVPLIPCKTFVKKSRKKYQPPPPPPEEPKWVGRSYYILHTNIGFNPKKHAFPPAPRDPNYYMDYPPVLDECFDAAFDIDVPRMEKYIPDPMVIRRVRKKKYVKVCVCRMPVEDCICEFLGNEVCRTLPTRTREACDRAKALLNRADLCPPKELGKKDEEN